ncbi:hypothetical protein MesoLjLb_24340 [Mesorhizobium sp. L-8-3]|nr:hypothetical protein MesoLjLb_24340 [Mesorhizobium sp. L-8-3]
MLANVMSRICRIWARIAFRIVAAPARRASQCPGLKPCHVARTIEVQGPVAEAPTTTMRHPLDDIRVPAGVLPQRKDISAG